MPGDVVLEHPASSALAVVRLDNGARRNAISAPMWQRIEELAGALGARDDIRAVLVRGTGGVFSAGADISGFEGARSGTSNASAYDDLVENACRLFEAVPQPTIALIEGFCFGAGASLAASCDLRVAASGASFAVPAGRLGLGYDPRGIARFLRVFGPATLELLLTAAPLPAERAHALGAVHRLAPAPDAEAAAFALAERIAANAPLTLRAAKLAARALRADDDALYAQALALAARADASADYAEGRAAFAEKRAPCFRGL